MRNLILSTIMLFGAFEATAAGRTKPQPPFQLPEICDIFQVASYSANSRQFLSESAVQRFGGTTKSIYPGILLACDKFYDNCIVGAVQASHINAFLDVINTEIARIGSWHQIVFSEVASRLVSAGMARSILSDQPQFPDIANDVLQEFFRFGTEVAKSIMLNPLELLRCEIYRDTLLELAQDPEFPNVLNRLENPLFDLEKVFVPFTFLETVHTERSALLTADGTLAALFPVEQDGDGAPLTPPLNEFRSKIFNDIVISGDVLLTTNARAQSARTLPPNPFGYPSDVQKLPMIPNLTSTTLTSAIGQTTQLNESTKKWLICKAAIRYLYENPLATIEDAIEASINMVQGMSSDKDHPFPLGSTIASCKAASAALLHDFHARDLCQVGRWSNHCSLLRQLSQEFGGKFRRYYYPGLKYIGHNDVPQEKPADLDDNELVLNQATFPVISRKLVQINNHGAGNCGVYSTLFQSRADLIKWLNTIPAWAPFLPGYLKDGRSRESLSMHGQLNGVGTIIQTDGYLIRMGNLLQRCSGQVLADAKHAWECQRAQFLSLTPAEQKKQSKLHPGAKEWNDQSAKREYGSALAEVIRQMGCDFGYIASLHGRTIQMWRTRDSSKKQSIRPTDAASPENFTSLIIPDGHMTRSVRSRTMHLWATSGHYMSLIELGDYVGMAKCIRHLASGTAL